jgi:CubicO group peptidase (beta-lactamase class C family)
LGEKLRAEAATESFSGVALIAKDGEPVFHEAYGYADKNADLPNRLDTKFNLGSINKLFTTVAVYQLLEAGKLNLDDTIGKYLPQFPPAVADSVTVKHLLDHRSGWGAYWDNPTWNARRSELRSLDDYMAFIKDIPLDFEPGTRMQYSNTGYEVLGAIVQKASGQSYYDYVRDHIYKPARMNSTDAYDLAGDTPNLARGYAGGGYGEDNSTMLAVRGTAAGGGFSTAGDLMRFVEALGAGRLVSPKHANRLLHGSFAGGGPGVNTALHMNVSGNHTVVVLSNFDPPAANQVARMLSDSVAAESGVKQYRIGVAMIPHQDGVAVDFLVPGGPGEKGGLEPEDVIVAMNGSSIADDPIGRFDAALTGPDPIRLKVRRGDTLKDITITPELKGAEGAETTLAASGSCRP